MKRSGYYRWIILVLVWAAFLISLIDRLAWSSVAAAAGASFGLQIAALNIFVTAFYVGYVLSNIGSGVATDLVGGRYMLVLALVPLGLFTFLFSFATSVEVGFVLQALMGVAAGADYAAGMKLIATWFDNRDRGRAMGLYFTAPTIGVLITNATVPLLLRSADWTDIYRILGIITALLGLICLIALRDRPEGARVEGARVESDGGASPAVADAAGLLRNRDLILLALAGFCGMWGSFGFVFWANALMIYGHHLTPVAAGGIMALFGIGAILGNPLMGAISDWFGGKRKIPIIICLASLVALLLVFGGLSGQTQFQLAAPLLGIAAFVYMPLMGAMVAEIAGVALAGAATGFTNACWQLGTIIVPVAVGLIFQATQSFYVAFMAIAAGPLIGVLFMLPVRERRKRIDVAGGQTIEHEYVCSDGHNR